MSGMRSLEGLARPADGDGPATARTPVPPTRWKTRVLLPGVIFVTVVLLLLVTSAQTLLPATPVRVVPVVVKSVEGSAGTVTVQAPGWLEPDPHPYYVAALADGVVDEVTVLEGDRVEAGQVVARLIDDDARLALKRAEAVLDQRRAGVLAARSDLTAATLGLEHLVERSRAVAVAKAVVEETRAQLEMARADIAVEEAKRLEIQDEYDRKSRLTDSQAVSEAAVARLRLRLEAQQSVVAAAAAREAVLAAKLEQAEAEQRAATTDRELLIEERRAVGLAQAALATAEASVALAEAVRDEAALRLARMEVRSPVAGHVMRRLASPGSKLTREGEEHSSHVVHLYDPRRLQVRVDVPLADAAHVAVGQAVEVTVEVLADRTFTGSVTRIVPKADIQKNTVEVKVAITDPTNELTPEMLARVRFLARNEVVEGSARERVFAPSELVGRGDGGDSIAFVVTGLVDERGRVERRTVVPGARRIDGWIEIESGLQVGDLLVAEPADGLEPGDRVRVVGERQPGDGA